MEQVLELINRGDGVLGSAILSGDGSVKASNFRDNISVDQAIHLAQMAGKACEQAISSAGRGAFFRATITGSEGYLLIYGLQSGYLAVFSGRHTNIGLLRLMIERAVSQAQSNLKGRAA
jgi:predicted regulator of Ras-like GTPase activity (Roadblock/LC7/MglB family)